MEIRLVGHDAPVKKADGEEIVSEAYLTASKVGVHLISTVYITIRLKDREISVDSSELKSAIDALEQTARDW